MKAPRRISSVKTKLKEGKHAGKKVGELLEKHPDYLLYLFDKGYVIFSFELLEIILKKARFNR